MDSENWVHLSIKLDDGDPAPTDQRAETLARVIGINLFEVREIYILEDDGFGHLTRPQTPTYPTPEDSP